MKMILLLIYIYERSVRECFISFYVLRINASDMTCPRSATDLPHYKGETYRSGFRFLGLPQGNVGSNSGGLGRAHWGFGPGGDDTHSVRGHCWRNSRKMLSLTH